MERLAAIDIGSNTVLLLVVEQQNGVLVPIAERAEITRLGRGVDRTGRLDLSAIRDTVEVLVRYALEARELGAAFIACVATSAARDAENGAEFADIAREASGLVPETLSGEEEARLAYASAWRDFGSPPEDAESPLSVLDIGGGSTEFTSGNGPEPSEKRSLQIGAVRLTERIGPGDPMSANDLLSMRAAAREAMAPLRPLRNGRLVGVAGTVTTLAAVEQQLPQYDGERVHGSTLSIDALERLYGSLGQLTLTERVRLPGMVPKRADVIVAGCAVLLEAMRATGFDRITVSDRGVRWGLVYERASYMAGAGARR